MSFGFGAEFKSGFFGVRRFVSFGSGVEGAPDINVVLVNVDVESFDRVFGIENHIAVLIEPDFFGVIEGQFLGGFPSVPAFKFGNVGGCLSHNFSKAVVSGFGLPAFEQPVDFQSAVFNDDINVVVFNGAVFVVEVAFLGRGFSRRVNKFIVVFAVVGRDNGNEFFFAILFRAVGFNIRFNCGLVFFLQVVSRCPQYEIEEIFFRAKVAIEEVHFSSVAVLVNQTVLVYLNNLMIAEGHACFSDLRFIVAECLLLLFFEYPVKLPTNFSIVQFVDFGQESEDFVLVVGIFFGAVGFCTGVGFDKTFGQFFIDFVAQFISDSAGFEALRLEIFSDINVNGFKIVADRFLNQAVLKIFVVFHLVFFDESFSVD